MKQKQSLKTTSQSPKICRSPVAEYQIKKRAYGFLNRERFKTAIYFHCGRLKAMPFDPAPSNWHLFCPMRFPEEPFFKGVVLRIWLEK